MIRQQTAEMAVAGEFLQPRHRALVAQQRFRRHQDQGLADVALELAAQDVEVIGRVAAIGHLHIVFGAHLQEAFKARGGMFRTLAFIAMRQQADESRHAQPFALARRDELIEQHLRAIGEIAELALPKRQGVGFRQGISIFEPEHSLFREHRIDDLIAALAVANMVQRHIAAFVFLVG